MKRYLILMAVFLSVALVAPVAKADIKAPENPVHAARKALQDSQQKEHYGLTAQDLGGDSSSNTKDKGQTAKDAKDKNADKGDKDVLAGMTAEEKAALLGSLMKEFDTNADGVISYDEMEAAKAAGKDKELRALLADKRVQDMKKKPKKKDGKSSQDATGQKDPAKKSGPKEIIVTPNGE